MYKWPLMENTITWNDKWEMIKFIVSSDRFTNGQKVREFENSWNDWLGSKHSLYVSSGSTANLLLVSSIKEKFNLSNDTKVLLPACTWVTNVAPIIQCGLRPIFCDINLFNYSFDSNHLEEIVIRHPDIKVIFATHLLGFKSDTKLLQSLWPNAIIIEDICESHGVIDERGTKCGANSIGSTFSFYFGHHMTTIEGGMVSTNDSDLYSLMRAKRSHGLARELPKKSFDSYIEQYPNINPQFMFITDGYNFRNTEINAVLGLSQLKRLDKAIDIRRKNFLEFLNILKNFEEHFYIPYGNDKTNSSYAFPIVAKNKKIATNLKRQLSIMEIESRPIVGGNLLKQPFLRNYIMDGGTDKVYNADIINDNGVYVGNNHLIDHNTIQLLKPALEKAVRT